jgi:outer membrane protein
MKKMSLALAVLAAMSSTAWADPAGPWMVRVRAVHLDPANTNDNNSLGADVSINSKTLPEVDFSYFWSPNIAAELVLTYPQKQDVSLGGSKIGTLKHLPPTLTLQYHFNPDQTIQPYVGAGLNYTSFSSVDLPSGITIKKDSFGLALQAGVDVALGNNLYLNFDVKKVQIKTDVSVGGTRMDTLRVDPWLVGVGVGWRF